jgi:hypothetical protein
MVTSLEMANLVQNSHPCVVSFHTIPGLVANQIGQKAYYAAIKIRLQKTGSPSLILSLFSPGSLALGRLTAIPQSFGEAHVGRNQGFQPIVM